MLSRSKRCPRCDTIKPSSAFRVKTHTTRLRSHCKACEAASKKDWEKRYQAKHGRSRPAVNRKRGTWEQRIKELAKGAKARATEKGIAFELNKAWCVYTAKALELNPFCEATGTEMFLTKPRYRGFAHPSAPSLDRIDPRKGYTVDNVRVVCAWVNISKGTLMTEVHVDWCRAIVEEYDERRRIDESNSSNVSGVGAERVCEIRHERSVVADGRVEDRCA
jgi:hypothetical protein